MARRRRRLIIGTIAALVAAVVLFVWLALPPIVEARILAALEEAGLGPAAGELVRLTPWEAEMRRITLGLDAPLRIAAVRVTYTPRSLWAGTVHNVEVGGVVWHARYDEAGLHAAPFDQLSTGDGGGGGELPFRSITLKGLDITLTTPALRQVLSGDAQLARSGRDGATLHAIIVGDGEAYTGTAEASAVLTFAETLSWSIAARTQDANLTYGTDLNVGGLDLDISHNSATGEASVAVSAEAITAYGTRVGSLVSHATASSATEARLHEFVIAGGDLGRITIDPVTFDPTQAVLRPTLRLEAAPLAQVLRLTLGDRATGEGLVDGSLLVSVNVAPPLRILPLRGDLRARPGATLEVKDEATLRQAIASTGLASQPQLSEDLVAALRGFSATSLEVSVVPESPTPYLRIQLAGEGKSGGRTIPVGGVTLNLRGLVELGNASTLEELLDLAGTPGPPGR